jgi:hypothetical protein
LSHPKLFGPSQWQQGCTASLERLQDAEDARRLIEAEGSEALLLPADLSEGDATCQKIVSQVGSCVLEGGGGV